ncbi:MAG: patatin-like phospholipase family protein [Eubacterium sp.]
MNEYGLVLSGGGTKGAFEIGVWEALREMNIQTPCVIGTSVGALNAALIAQNDFEKARNFWSNLTINQVLNLNSKMTNKYVEQWSKTSFDFFRLSFINDLFRGGLDITPLRESLKTLISEKAIRHSPIRLGLVTVKLNTLSPVQLMIEDIPEGQLFDYLLASAALPVFQKQEIDGQTYLDGGFYDNVPINFMIENGYNNIISVEFPAMGIKQRVNNKNINLTVVNNSEYLGLTLEFDQKTINDNIQMGYLDCLRTFKAVNGKHYYFDMTKSHAFYDRLSLYIGTPLKDPMSQQKIANLLGIPVHADKELILTTIKRFIKNTNYPENEPMTMTLLEITGKSVGVKRDIKYSADQFLQSILNALNTLTQANLALIKQSSSVKNAFKDTPIDYKPNSLLDFITFYILFIGARTDMPISKITTLVKKFTPEFILSILVLIYIHQMLKES